MVAQSTRNGQHRGSALLAVWAGVGTDRRRFGQCRWPNEPSEWSVGADQLVVVTNQARGLPSISRPDYPIVCGRVFADWLHDLAQLPQGCEQDAVAWIDIDAGARAVEAIFAAGHRTL